MNKQQPTIPLDIIRLLAEIDRDFLEAMRRAEATGEFVDYVEQRQMCKTFAENHKYFCASVASLFGFHAVKPITGMARPFESPEALQAVAQALDAQIRRASDEVKAAGCFPVDRKCIFEMRLALLDNCGGLARIFSAPRWAWRKRHDA